MEILNEQPIDEQSTEFQDFFNAEILPKIDFAESCNERDEFNRPLSWLFADCEVRATYFTKNENYNFNKFVIYGRDI